VILVDRSGKETAITLGGTWLAFVVALCLALPQPPNLLYIGIGAAAGAVLTTAGFFAASRSRAIRSHSPRQRAILAGLATIAGSSLGVALLLALVVLSRFEPALHARFAGRLSEPLWRPWALGFESSILEEITFRLFGMSVTAWIAGRFVSNLRAVFAIALLASALMFGLVHLPAWLAMTQASPALIACVLVLNGTAAVLFGWAFWRWGLPYGIVCHLLGDVVVQGLGPRFLA
jgi:hypothetical protein